MATKEDIKEWLNIGKKDGKIFMSVYCDTFDYNYFPVYAESIAEFWRKYNDPYHQPNHMCRLIEVYDLSLDTDFQLSEARSFHLPERE